MSAAARSRLSTERKNWRKNRPYGFVARPLKLPDGSQDIMRWRCEIPGPDKSIWAGTKLIAYLEFPDTYPENPPVVRFQPVIFHPNVFDTGAVCLSIINPNKAWKPSINISIILQGVQKLLADPNLDDPADWDAMEMCRDNFPMYEKRVKAQIASFNKS